MMDGQSVETLAFWFEDLLKAARCVQEDLMRFYEPDKGWPPHIMALMAPADYDTVLANAKRMLAREFPRA
ncbi:unnamed protein product [marine sediment metagenome]|uniref:Uncharacterized protein n=1 Tax=marine sediment metagenome TaxID=412755 RepID=X0SNM4_9ZZZZ